jgi:hypothetical protein
MLRDQPLELGDELGGPTAFEVGVDPPLLDDQAELLESARLVLRERLVREVGEGRPAPEL